MVVSDRAPSRYAPVEASRGRAESTVAVVTASPLPADVTNAIAAMPAEYRPLLVRVRDALERDSRFLALFLGGSIGRGVADAGSDLDLLVSVSDAEFDTIAVELADVLADPIDPVITLAIPGMPGTNAYTTRQGLRVDVVLERLAEVDRPAFRRRVTVFDRAGVGALISPAEDPNSGPDPATLAAIVQEFLRQQAIFPAAFGGRADWLLVQEGVHNAKLMLYQLFVETNQPLPAMGVKQWSSKLTPAQRTLLESLDPPAARPAAVLAAMIAVREAFRTSGREAAEAAGMGWPTEVDDAIAGYWRRNGLDG
jgi:predicted nucleotidyltransferase